MFQTTNRIVLSVPHFKQQSEGDCLAACALMIMMYYNQTVRYRRLLRVLGTQEYGTPFSNLRRLNEFGYAVEITNGTLEQLYLQLLQRRPTISSVQTSQLPYWPRASEHAVAIVGMDDRYVYVNDPVLDNGPTPVPLGDFDLAWLEQDELCAVITP